MLLFRCLCCIYCQGDGKALRKIPDIKNLLFISYLVALVRIRFYFLLTVFLCPFFSLAQLCNGSLGDPAVNITFAAGSTNYTPTNGYQLTTSDCPNDGQYTITSRSTACFGNTWHTVTQDHTGTGGFMLVNASFSPGDFFLTSVSDLCPNTTYEFAAWIMNVLRVTGIKPNITFRIETPDGTILNQFSTGDIPETSQPQWKQYGFYFTTPTDNAQIVLRMTNNAPGGVGNDLALDDITFRPCGPSVTATVNAPSDTANVCEGYTDVYNYTGAVSTIYQNPVYQWQVSNNHGVSWQDIPGANSITYQAHPIPPGDYWYRMAVVESRAAALISCRINSNYLVVNVHPKPVLDAGPDRTILSGNSATIAAIASGEGLQYTWSPPDFIDDVSLLNPTISPTADITYTLNSISQFGCVNSDFMKVKVVADIFIPSAFTPNHDGKNDRWEIPYLDPAFGASVKVFNRYGQLVYRCEAATVSWDGKLNGVDQVSGVYVYMVSFKTSKGTRLMKGSLSLIR